jgi:hypothetical protein
MRRMACHWPGIIRFWIAVALGWQGAEDPLRRMAQISLNVLSCNALRLK